MDSIHGLTGVEPSFWRVIDAPEVQRLRWIRQTGLAYLVYPGAEHSRFAHAVGAYSLACRVFDHLRKSAFYTGVLSPSHLEDSLRLAFTTAALCHDLGHTAFSHVLETLLLPRGINSHEECTFALLKEGEVGKRISGVVCDLDQVLQLLRRTHWNDGLSVLLSGDFDVDRADYLMRDAAACGLVYGNFDLNWLIHSFSLHPDSQRRPRLHVESHRGLVALEHFLSARRSMYQQVYYHTAVRGAETLLRAVFERACDPARLEKHKKDSRIGIPACLRSVLRGERPSLGEFRKIDDTTIITALKAWSESSKDPVLKYLAQCLIKRNLFKEIRIGSSDLGAARKRVKGLVSHALKRQRGGNLPAIDRKEKQVLDYLVLVDTSRFKAHHRFDSVLFDVPGSPPEPFESIQQRPEHDILTSQRPFTRTRLFVPSEVADSVKRDLEKAS